MLKIEYIWRELLYQTIEKKSPYFKISDLSKKFKMSTSVVSHALIPLKGIGAVSVSKKRSQVTDVEKLLFFWATRRNLQNEIVYQTYSSQELSERETSMPASVTPTAYSAYRFYFSDIPADYDIIYFYSKKIDEIKERFPENKKRPANIIILREDPFLRLYKKAPLSQIFVDLWNLPEWYSKDFYEAVLLKIKEHIGL